MNCKSVRIEAVRRGDPLNILKSMYVANHSIIDLPVLAAWQQYRPIVPVSSHTVSFSVKSSGGLKGLHGL